MKTLYDVVIIGAGPAGFAAAVRCDEKGKSVLLVEREARLGGILKQCIHDGFGLIRFSEKLSGPEYAERYIDMLKETKCDVTTLTFVTDIEKKDELFTLTLVSREGVFTVQSKTLILATGCRERTAKQVNIHGTRPAGVFTAGTAQNLTNLLGQLPT
ncbi:MAG: FAD-dependent oxidoreductase, partial [Clostridia bacterium]|nr:FAD-dependent oxidoreductase [Clostridia bacterium]